jgi:hypothetical protein
LRERLGFDPCNLLGFYAGEHASASFFGYTFFCGKKRCRKDKDTSQEQFKLKKQTEEERKILTFDHGRNP